jgi:hypothetical protein
MADAVRLAEALRENVFAEVDGIGGCADASIGVVRRNDDTARLRWGVLVRVGRPQRGD